MATIDIKVPDIGDFAEVAVIEVMVQPGDSIKAEHRETRQACREVAAVRLRKQRQHLRRTVVDEVGGEAAPLLAGAGRSPAFRGGAVGDGGAVPARLAGGFACPAVSGSGSAWPEPS